MCFQERASFAFENFRVGGIGAYLHKEDATGRVNGVEIQFVSSRSAKVVEFTSAALKFDQDGGFEGMAEVCSANPFVNGNEPRVDRIGFARIDHSLALGSGEERGGADQESVFKVGEEGVEAIFGNRKALRF